MSILQTSYNPIETAGAISSPTISAIIPAFNEEGRLAKVLAVLQNVAELSEIIVVDDGSTDGTQAEAKTAARLDSRIRCLSLPVNRGKGAAMFTGAQAATGSILVFFDADLLGLKPEHVRALIKPVSAGQMDMTVGVFSHGRLNTDFAHHLTPWLSGQRCLRTELFFKVVGPSDSGYGIETAITLTARRQQWRSQYIPWRGVTHPPTEARRGLKQGVRNRIKMYDDIRKTFRAERRPSFRARPVWLALSLVVLLLMGSSMVYDQAIASSPLQLVDLPDLPLAGVHRLLVIAPHPDDETLGAGGVIQAALAAGAQVKVVVITNGDGQAVAPLVFEEKLWPHSIDYVHAGERRQAESTAALKTLGVPSSAVMFLGYPDGRLNQLWLNNWTTACPVRAEFTRAIASPYPLTYDTRATYCGRDLLDDLQKIVTAYRPDLVLLPHPNDEHPDHRATSSFSRLALALVSAANPGYAPQVEGYLVHYGRYPQPRGLRLGQALLPPTPLASTGYPWLRFELTPRQLQTKEAALQAYTTQLDLMPSFLDSFVRQNELFAAIQPLDPLALTASEPADENSHELVLGGADLVGLQVERHDQVLSITAKTEEPLLPGFRYRLLAKLPNGQTVIGSWPGGATHSAKNAATFNLNLAALGSPAVVAVAAEVTQGVRLDRTAWYMVQVAGTAP